MKPVSETRRAHHGYNVQRLCEIMGVSPKDLAERTGLTIDAISKLENKEVIEEKVLDKISKALNIPSEAIKNYRDEASISIVSNSFDNNGSAVAAGYQYQSECTFNPVDKIVELYERMLKIEQEKIALLEEALKQKK